VLRTHECATRNIREKKHIDISHIRAHDWPWPTCGKSAAGWQGASGRISAGERDKVMKTKLFKHNTRGYLAEVISDRDGLVIYHAWGKDEHGKEIILQRNGSRASIAFHADWTAA
jgi:hypothetical protein